MEIPQMDGNQEDQERADKKIIGRGFRPALKTPKNFPYPLELNYRFQSLALDFDEKRNKLNVSDTKQAKTVSVEIHPRGLLLMVNQKKYIIPGELSLAKTVDLLAEEYNPIKQIIDDPDVKEKFTDQDSLNATRYYSDIADDAREQTKSLALKHRKREIAGALLANNLWQKRGFVDKEKVAPKNFWQVVPVEEIIIGDKRNLKRWWEASLARSLINSIGHQNYGLKIYQNFEYGRAMKMQELAYKDDHLTEKEYAAKIKSYRVHEIIEKNALLKPIRNKIKEGFLPEYPWEIRDWDKIPFEPLKKALLYGLHKMPEWEAYIKSGAPRIEGIIDVLENGLTAKKNVYNTEEDIENYNKNRLKQRSGFLQPFKPEIEERIRRSLALFTEGKISEAQRIFPDKNAFFYDNNNKLVGIYESYIKKSIIKSKIRKKKQNFIDIFKDKRKNQFIVPDFACIDGWEWNKSETSILALKIIKEEEQAYRQKFIWEDVINKVNREISKKGNVETVLEEFLEKILVKNEKIEEKRIDNSYSLKCIATKNENGIQKEAVLGINPSDENWYGIGYRNCDVTDLRKVKIFCRTLDAIKKELKPKINTDEIITDIQKEQIIGNSLFLNTISQLNQTSGR